MEIYKATNTTAQDAVKISTKHINNRAKKAISIESTPWTSSIWKRGFDFLFSLLFTVTILSWAYLLLGIIIRLNSRGSIFFIQKRIGKNGRVFSCYKFRTMHPNELSDTVQAKNDDARITSIGKWLRLFHLDELPQIINILLGDMSFVGPRPHMLADDAFFTASLTCYSYRRCVKPGLTGLAQIKGFHGYIHDIRCIANRTKMDLFYVRKATFLLDVKILMATLIKPFSQKLLSHGERCSQ